MEKLFDRKSHSLQHLMSAVERLAKKAKLNIQKEKEGTLQVVVAVAVHHLRMMSLQKGENNNPFWSIQTLSKKHSF